MTALSESGPLRHTGPLDLAIRAEAIDRVISPFVTQRFAADDPTWAAKVHSTKQVQTKQKWRRRLLGTFLPWMVRSQAGILDNYSRHWATFDLQENLGASSRQIYLGWRGSGLKAATACLHHTYHLLLMRAIDRLKPRSVLEIGFGSGVNLLVLAARFPNVAFSGVEIAEGGVETARKVAQCPELPEFFAQYAPEPLLDLRSAARIDFRQGNAQRLPYADGSFDLVFSVLALEQMEEIKDRVLTEMARVSGRHVAMVEPFRDWNADGAKRDYIIANDYFSSSIADVEAFGLRHLYATGDFPAKLRLGVGFALFEKTGKPVPL